MIWDSVSEASIDEDRGNRSSPMSIASSVSPEARLGGSAFAPSSLVMLHNSLMKTVEEDSEEDYEPNDYDIDGRDELTDLLHGAIADGKTKLFAKLVTNHHHANFDEQFRDFRNNGCSLMHKAAKYNRVTIMTFLCDKGAAVEIEDDLQATPIFYAAAAGALQSCAFLLGRCAQLNIRDRNDSSPLSIALKYNHLEAARMMILANADVNYKVGKGDPVLHLACEEGNMEKVVFLIKNGSTLLRTNASNENCLFVALPHPIIVNILCRHASDNSQLIKMVRSTDANGNTAIHRCAQGGYFESLERILQSLNATKTKDDIAEIFADQDKTKNNDTCLHMAAANGHVEVVRYILDVCKSVQLDLQRFENRNGDTPLHCAVRAKRGECVLLLKNSDKKGRVQKHKNYEKLTPKALAEQLNVVDIWNFTVEETPVSPSSMLDRLFRRKQSLANVKEVKA